MAAPGRQLDEAIDQRRGDHARRDTVGKAAGAGEHSVHFIGAQMDLEPTGLECLGDAIKPRRQNSMTPTLHCYGSAQHLKRMNC